MSTSVLTFYNNEGRAVAYLFEGQHIYLYGGKPVAWMRGEDVYAYSGKFLGWLEDGWIRDRDGGCVFFTDNASGGPLKPVKKLRPLRGLRGLRPLRGIAQIRPIRAIKSLGWSPLTSEVFFNQ